MQEPRPIFVKNPSRTYCLISSRNVHMQGVHLLKTLQFTHSEVTAHWAEFWMVKPSSSERKGVAFGNMFHVVKNWNPKQTQKWSLITFKRSIVLAIPVFPDQKKWSHPQKKVCWTVAPKLEQKRGFACCCWLSVVNFFCTLVKLALITCEQRKNSTTATKPRTPYKFNPLPIFFRGKFA